jgi:hypothetical protein
MEGSLKVSWRVQAVPDRNNKSGNDAIKSSRRRYEDRGLFVHQSDTPSMGEFVSDPTGAQNALYSEANYG